MEFPLPPNPFGDVTYFTRLSDGAHIFRASLLILDILGFEPAVGQRKKGKSAPNCSRDAFVLKVCSIEQLWDWGPL